MGNEGRPISDIQTFVAKAKNVGVYNASQAANLVQSLRLASEHARAHGVDIDQLTVAQAAASVDEWLDEYGGENRATVQSIATYKGRAKKLLDDFIKWNGGDFMAWKKTLVKAPRATKKPKAIDTAPAPATPVNSSEQVHVWRLPGNKSVKLTLPDPITKQEIEAAWKVITAYKTVLVAQAQIDAGEVEETDDGDGEAASD